MDAAEILWRIESFARDRMDSIRIPLGLIPKLPSQYLTPASGFRPGFHCSPIRTDDWAGDLCSHQKEWLANLVSKADAILENRLTYFDLESVDHGTPFNWHRDHSANIDSPVRLAVHTDYRNFSVFGDCKLVWEPNRHHQLVVLGRAFIATNDARYPQKVSELLRDWIEANPFGYGMNWKSPLELGIRLINWVWAIDLIRHSSAFDDRLWHDVLNNVYLATWECARKFSSGSSANNHLIGEAAGVFISTLYFRDLPNFQKWHDTAKRILEDEILAQSYTDGCGREHAFGYQQFTMQFFTLCMHAADNVGQPFSDAYRSRLNTMYRFLADISEDTGQPPLLGDSDDGYVLDLGNTANYSRALSSIGAHLFSDNDLTSPISCETTFWLLGLHPSKQTQSGQKRRTTVYSESGYAIIRSERASVFFDFADLGYGSLAAHGHSDCLSFCLSIDGKPFFIDPGTYDYFSFPTWRNYFRQTRAHNTIEIDGVSQSQALGPFLWGQRARPKLIDFQESERLVSITASHDGYSRLKDATSHERTIALCKDSHIIRIVDRVNCSTGHTGVLTFTAAADCEVEQITPNQFSIRRSGIELLLESCITSENTSNLVSSMAVESGWTSRRYHEKHTSSLIRCQICFRGPTLIETTISLLPTAS